MSEIDELRAKVDRFERIMRALIEHPFIHRSPSFRHLAEEMGYKFVVKDGTDYETLVLADNGH